MVVCSSINKTARGSIRRSVLFLHRSGLSFLSLLRRFPLESPLPAWNWFVAWNTFITSNSSSFETSLSLGTFHRSELLYRLEGFFCSHYFFASVLFVAFEPMDLSSLSFVHENPKMNVHTCRLMNLVRLSLCDLRLSSMQSPGCLYSVHTRRLMISFFRRTRTCIRSDRRAR
ncbi:hypothetical protein FB446DRAFT_139813 [Lentinula raphanica]|nr:hypothetical protein FB446DRAFT_139813 [Lentinula raphanica]